MSGFNITTTKKEDVSLKLKSQNLRNSKEQTKRLEQESKRMELRLHELKIAMSKEKEEREAQGGNGSYWKSGKTEGTLTTHAQDVLNKNLRRIEKSKAKSSKPMKITVLKDERIVAPQKSAPQPGTMAYLANSDPYSAPKESARSKGPKCGQCERKVAAVNCQECGEDYCAACFASFHLKGALRKHRSMPIQANGPRPSPRVSYEPRPPLHQVQNEIVTPQQRAMREFERRQTTPRPAKPVTHQHSHEENGGSASSGEPSQFTGPSLLDGAYNEDDSAASFQAALQQWRGDDSSQASAPRASFAPKPVVGVRPYIPVKTPTVNVDDSTSTNPVRDANPDIVFHSTMTYSEKLLLKKHRRSEIEALHTPRVDSYGRPTGAGQDYALSLPEDEERVDFRALYEAAVTPRSDSQMRTPSSMVEVTEMAPNANTRGIEQVSQYEVVEESDPEVEAILLRNKTNVKNSPSKSAGKSGRRTLGDKSKLPPSGGSKGKLERENTGRSSANFERENPGKKSSARLEREKMGSKENLDRPNSRVKREKSDTNKDARITQKRGSIDKLEAEKTDITLEQSGRPPTGSKKASADNGKVVNGRPSSQAKSKSWTSVQSRPQSRTKSRAQSRSGSRARPWSRADIPEGNITKRPSEGLKAIASRTWDEVSPSPYTGLQDILTIGVSKEAAPQVNRVMTPSFDRPGSRVKSAKKGPTVSYKFYQMSPRSWKPQVSMGDQVDIQPSDIQDYDHAFAMAELEAQPMFEDKDLEQEIKALAGITKPSPDVIRERLIVDQRHEDDMPPVPASPEMPLPSPPQTPIPAASSPSMTPRPPQSPSNMPRRRSVRSVTLRKQVTPVATPTPRPRPSSSMSELGRESRMIVVDGDDMTEYDDQDDANHDDQREDDAETLNKLEWELASETGRITADGKISRMSLMNSSDDELARSDSFASSNLEDAITTPRTGYEMDPRVSEEELNFDYEDIEQQVADEDEVRALR